MKKRGPYKTANAKLKEQAKHHITIEGLKIKDTANRLGVSERGVSKWIKEENWASKTKKEQRKIRNKAKYLVVMKGFKQKEVSKIIGVSEKSISDWSKVGHWQQDIKRNLRPEKSIKDFIAKFFTYLFLMEHDIIERLKNRWYEFLKGEEKEIDI
jgi:transposase